MKQDQGKSQSDAKKPSQQTAGQAGRQQGAATDRTGGHGQQGQHDERWEDRDNKARNPSDVSQTHDNPGNKPRQQG